jgi:hypothetical protein
MVPLPKPSANVSGFCCDYVGLKYRFDCPRAATAFGRAA